MQNIQPLLDKGRIERTAAATLTSALQRYRMTAKGRALANGPFDHPCLMKVPLESSSRAMESSCRVFITIGPAQAMDSFNGMAL